MALCYVVVCEGRVPSIFPWLRNNDRKSLRGELIRLPMLLGGQEDGLLISIDYLQRFSSFISAIGSVREININKILNF
jgi:hypothetical protein